MGRTTSAWLDASGRTQMQLRRRDQRSEHQDRPGRWLGFVRLYLSPEVENGAVPPNTRLGLTGNRFADIPVDFEQAVSAADCGKHRQAAGVAHSAALLVAFARDRPTGLYRR
jgi:hypothetical protein